MPNTFNQPLPFKHIQKRVNNKSNVSRAVSTMDLARGILFGFLAVWLLTIIGCGAGGYAGGGIQSITDSGSGITIDAGQSFKFTTTIDGSPTVTYALTGVGSLSNTTGTTVVYTAPTGISTQTVVTLTAEVAGTKSQSSVAITVNPDPTLAGTPPAGTVGVAYTASLNPAGGTAPLTLSIASGSLPPGLSFNATTGAITGTPTSAGTFSFSVQLVDSSAVPFVLTTQETIVVSTPVSSIVISGNPPAGIVGSAYSTAFAATGGTAPYTFSLLSGVLPAGLTLSPAGVISGSPITQGVSVFTLQAQDSLGNIASAAFSINITSQSLSLTISSLPNGTVSVPYSSTIGVTGGTAPYNCTITSGTLPAGLKITGCLVSGTPTTAGTSNLIVMATDSSNPMETTTGPVSLTINPAGSLTLTSPPPGTANIPYSGTIGVSGGTMPYSCAITAGTLPAGLTISNCTISGTPTTPGTTTITVKGTDSSNPALTTTGPVIIVINPGALSLTLSSLPNGTVNVPYSSTIGVTGGTAPYSCTITAGTLPAGLSLAGCLVSGTPTVAGTVNLTVKAVDSGNPQETTTGPVSLTINPASLSLTLTTLPNGTVNVPYSQTIGVSGGTAPYACVITNGTLPSGLSLGAACLVSGTPTVAETVKLTVKATDSSSTPQTTTGPVSLTINPAAATLVITSPPAGTINTPYTGLIGVSGGTAPYMCAITLGTLPAGLTISNCTISGTPTASGSTPLTVKATDSSTPALTTTGPVTLVINPASATLTITSPPPATVDTPYTGPIGITGGTGPYTCTISGTLPAGLMLTSAGCVITGTPTTTGTTTVTVTATGSGTSPVTGTGPVTITVQALSPLTLTGTLPSATVGVAYSQTLTAQGGLPPYSYAITAGALPAGLTLSPGGVISGTPTVAGASSFTVTATDSETPKQTASLPLVLQVLFPPTPNDAELVGPYAYLFQGHDDFVIGVLSFQTATVGSFTADGLGGISAGEMDANHQTSTSTTNTITSNNFLGTYTIASNNLGSLAITVLNADGTTGATTTYGIAVKAPVSPATVSTAGSLIETDDDQLTGTTGNGSFLAQTPAAFSAGLNGSYAFGVSGDTVCLLTCTIGLIGDPAATVGQFTTDGTGSITDGESDTNIATTNIADSALAGTYSTADTNGRVQLSMTTSNVAGDAYPTDYAVYMVNGTQAFIVSTDVHSAFILLSGTTQQQSMSDFGSSPIEGPYVGYENSQVDPGILGTSVTLQQVTNFSTGTLFQGTGAGDGQCTVNFVDMGGVSGLLNGLGSLLGNLLGAEGIFGGFTQTGTADCSVTANGRGVMDYPAQSPGLLGLGGLLGLDPTPAPRVFYLSSPNNGYFLETSYAALGKFEAQTGAPFSEANTFTATYVYSSAVDSSLASIASTNNIGVITSNGMGTATSTLDSSTVSVAVGTLDLIQISLDQTATQPYTAPNSSSGRFTLGSGGTVVVYAINPNRFVLLDTSALATAPSVSLLF
jgi:Putative Ig domain